MKHQWRKDEKGFYIPPKKPVVVDIPDFNFLTIEGTGNPSSPSFAKYIEALYTVSYAVKMTIKKTPTIKESYDYTVYPLEGIWDISEEAKESYNGSFSKDDLVFKLMIRQPEFVSKDFVIEMIEKTRSKSKVDSPLLSKLQFEKIKDGLSVQMMHLGSYDNEPESFSLMESFATDNNLNRVSKKHREIYISDPRRVSPENLKTVLRFWVDK